MTKTNRISNLSPEKRAMLEARLKEKLQAKKGGKQSIPRQSIDGPIPLSFSQQRLWFLNQLDPDSPTYNISRAVRITGPLNKEALHQALTTIVTRHTTLRTTFTLIDDEPRQIVSQDWALDLPMFDLSHLSEAEKDAEIDRIIEERSRHPFNLTTDLMLRTTLLQLDTTDYILVFVVHHVASDGWSTGVLLREISAWYTTYSGQGDSSLPELPIHYTDYALWQRDHLQGDVLEKQLAYWKEQLAGAPAVLELPTDHPRAATKHSSGGRQAINFPLALQESLKALSQQENTTMFMTLLAAFKTLLYRYTAQENVVVGSPVANRSRVEVEPLIGFFVNTLVLHTDLSGNPTFRDILARVREVALGAYAHQELPFEKLVEELQPERNLHINPLFQVMFILQDGTNRTLSLPGLTTDILPRKIGTEQFDLTLSIHESATGLTGYLTYNADLFEATTIERMVGHFQTLLEGIVADPNQLIAQLPLLTASEREQLLVTFNATEAPRQVDQCLHHLFEAQVVRTPQAIAVVSGNEQLTYEALNQRANQLAHYLTKRGVGPETLVAICMDRSLEMVIGLMAILKAGAGYVPLDPTYPADRLAFIVNDAQAPILLTQHKLIDRLPPSEAQIIELDTDNAAILQEPQTNVPSEVSGHNVAYVMYTSGSTGVPKGVVVLHRGVCNYLLWRQSYFPLNETDRALQKTSFSFVDSVWELFEPLMVGAQLIMAEPNRHQDTNYLVKFIIEQKITAVDFIPSLLHLFLEEPDVAQCTSLRRVTTGSETVTVDLQTRFFTHLNAGLYNLYGPTEASIATTCWTCQPDDDRRSVPIGRPIANSQIYLLDKYLQPAPLGFPGEVHIGGRGLARGYLNQPDLTAEKFIRHPFNDDPEARLYKTGDLARYLPDGTLEFLGRADHQVKIRGYRVELGEIEAFLRQVDVVQEAVAIVREDRPGDKRLVAYVIANNGGDIDPAQLRDYLKEKLPDYMIPSAFVDLEKMPMTPNGKVDRKQLPEPDWNTLHLANDYVEPEGLIEEMVAEVWQTVLGLDRVGLYDNFFDLGGHSLLAIQVISRLRHDYSIELMVHTLFEAPTIAELVPVIEESLTAES